MPNVQLTCLKNYKILLKNYIRLIDLISIALIVLIMRKMVMEGIIIMGITDTMVIKIINLIKALVPVQYLIF
jgi:hypothetical protein